MTKINQYPDPLVEEVRERGRRLTSRYDNDPKRIMEAQRDRFRARPEKFVSQIRVIHEMDSYPERK